MSQLISIEDYIEDIKPFLPKLIEASQTAILWLHSSELEQVWGPFGEVVEGMDDLYKALYSIDQDISENHLNIASHQAIQRALNELSLKFTMLNQLMDFEDYTRAADCIQYELIPIFEQLLDELGAPKDYQEQLFNKNMQFLSRDYQHIYAQLSSEIRDIQAYQLSYARNGSANLIVLNSQQGKSSLYSEYDPEHEAREWVNLHTKTQKQAKLPEVLFFGFGLGYHIQAYAKQYPDSCFAIFEPDAQVFLSALYVLDLESFFSSVTIVDFVIGSNAIQLKKMLLRYACSVGKEFKILSTSIYEEIYIKESIAFKEQAKIEYLSYNNHLNVNKNMGMQWVENGLRNMSLTLKTPNVSSFKNVFNNTTAVIVGAGPSLEEDIDYLKKLKNHAVIIAAGTAIQTLLHHQIKPHLIVSVDGSEGNFNAFSHLDLTDIPLLYSPTVHHAILGNFPEQQLCHLFVGTDWMSKHFLELNNEDVIFRSTHSVTGTAIQAAVYMGCKEVVFAGQDFSYFEDKIYAPGAKHVTDAQVEYKLSDARLTVENVKGSFNATTATLAVTLADIEELVGSISNVKFINTSNRGAKIKHTHWESLESVYSRHQSNIISNHYFYDMLRATEKVVRINYDVILKRLSQLPNSLSICALHLSRIIDTINSLDQLYNQNVKRCMNAIEAIDRDWEIIVEGDAFNGVYIQSCRIEIENFERNLEKLTAAKEIEQQINFYQTYMLTLVVAMMDQMTGLEELIAAIQE